MRHALVLASTLVMVSVKPAAALADDPTARARILFNAGAQAYGAGRYQEAVVALADAYALTPDRPTVVFSLAQAERRQYTVTHERRYLHAGIEHFRKYLALVRDGGRRGDAVEGLGELEAILARLESSPSEPGAEEAAPPPQTAARITVTVSTKEALISLDGRESQPSPLVLTVSPGRHVVRVSAPGFLDEARELTAVDGLLVPLEIELHERPSYLALATSKGASITIDGKSYGESGGQDQIQLSPGVHLVALTQRGRRAYVERVGVVQGAVVPMSVDLRTSPQRFASLTLFGGAAALTLVAGGFAAGAAAKQSVALDVRAEAARQNISQMDLADYNDALASRDHLRLASGALFCVAGAIGLTATALFFFDMPAPSRALPEDRWGIKRGAVGLLPGGGDLRIQGIF